MGVPFEALIPYAVMLGVRSQAPPQLQDVLLTGDLRCLALQEQAFLKSDTSRMVEKGQDIQSTNGTVKVRPREVSGALYAQQKY